MHPPGQPVLFCQVHFIFPFCTTHVQRLLWSRDAANFDLRRHIDSAGDKMRKPPHKPVERELLRLRSCSKRAHDDDKAVAPAPYTGRRAKKTSREG